MKALITIIGPTASGKTRLAVQLAEKRNAEIISADSRQVYKNMDIGTGKDLDEYKNIPYHLIDICNAGYQYNLYQYIRDFHTVYNNDKSLILCGGTGLYVQAVLQGYSLTNIPENDLLRKKLKNKNTIELQQILGDTDESSKKRLLRAIEKKKHIQAGLDYTETNYPAIQSVVIGINIPTDLRRKKISQRLIFRLENGMVEEVERLLNQGISHEQLYWYGLEYKFLSLYLQKVISYDEMFKQLETSIHQFAKRQMTYFRKMEKDGIKIYWVDYKNPLDESLRIINNH